MAVLPVRTRAVLRTDLKSVLNTLQDFLSGATDLLSGADNVNLIERSRELDRTVEKARTTIEPLTHPVSLASRRDFGTHVLTTLDRMAFRARSIAVRAEPAMLAGDARLTVLIEKSRSDIDVLLEAIDSGSTRRVLDHGTGTGEMVVTHASDSAEARSVFTSLDRLDQWIVELGKALGVAEAESVQPAVRRRTVPVPSATDSITSTSEEIVRRST